MGGIFSYPPNAGAACTWLPWNHILFQFANLFLVALYVGDFIKWKTGFHFTVFLRIVLSGCSICFSLWGFLVLCSRDTAGYNFVFFLYNIAQLVYVCYKEWRPSPQAYLDECNTKQYNRTFSSLPISVFNTIYNSGVTCGLDQGTLLDLRHVSNDKLSFIVSGQIIAVLKNGSHITLNAGEFLNITQWNVVEDSYHMPYIRLYIASTDSTLMVWKHSALTDLLPSPADQHSFSLIILQHANNLLIKILNTFADTENCDQNEPKEEKEECQCGVVKERGLRNGDVSDHVKIVIDNLDMGHDSAVEQRDEGVEMSQGVNDIVLTGSEESVNDDEAPLLNYYIETETNL